MASFLPPLLAILAIVSYFVLSAGFGIFQPIPWPHLLVAAAACVWALQRAAKLRRIAPIVAAVLTVVFTGLYAWYALSYSAYGEADRGLAAGQKVPGVVEVSLNNHLGRSAPVLAGAPARATLVVFYRGFW